MTTSIAHRVDATLVPDDSRVIAQLFLSGEEPPLGRSRAGAVVERVLALPEPEAERLARQLLVDFSHRHRDYPAILADHASMVSAHLRQPHAMSSARTLVLGASFTAEYAVEGAALCNPSAVLHPDQSGLRPGQARVALSLRGIGEGHISSIEFCAAVIGPGPRWEFQPRARPAVAGLSAGARWRREHLRAVLADQGRLDGLAHSVLAALPDVFSGQLLDQAIATAPHALLNHTGAQGTADLLRRLVDSAYEVAFPPDVALSQQVLTPSAAEERNGMEDARITRFVHDDARVEYRATYTAYDGRQIAPRLLTSADLRVFRADRLAGAAARNKGMALFPRTVDGSHLALCRTDGESTSLTRSDDGLVWDSPELVQAPTESWEVLHIGNCGPPIETDRGWLVVTHGVGAMRTYAIGAILLDLKRPTHVLARLEGPLLAPAADEREGYVPNVLYSCGGLVHDGRLWLPYGIGDARIGVAWADVNELLAAMAPVRR